MIIDSDTISKLESNFPEEKERLLKFLFLLGNRNLSYTELRVAGFSFGLFCKLFELFRSSLVWDTDILDLPKGLAIPSDIFTDLGSVTKVIIPDGFTTICRYAFVGCPNLKEIVIPDSVVHIYSSSLYGCDLDPDGLSPRDGYRIYKDLLLEQSDFTLSKIPDGVRIIADSAFYSVGTAAKIRIPDSVEYINSGAFGRCDKLKRLCLSSKAKTLFSETVSCCPNLTSVYIPDGVRYVEAHAFSNCDNLSVVHIPNSVVEIDLEAFGDSPSSATLTICTDSEYVKGVFAHRNFSVRLRPAAEFEGICERYCL